MALPTMMSCPPASVRTQITSADWIACVEAWVILSEAHLSLNTKEFKNSVDFMSSPLVLFLTSYMNIMGKEFHDVNYVQLSRNTSLHRNVFLLVHRIFTEIKQPPEILLHWSFLGDFSRVFRHTKTLSSLLETIWREREEYMEKVLGKLKNSLTRQLDSGQPSIVEDESFSHCLLPFIRVCTLTAAFMMIGSDLLDALVSAYSKIASKLRPRLLMFLYLGLNALIGGETPNHSLLFDHLYSLKAAGESKHQQSLLSDLVTDTPLMSRMQKFIIGPDEARATTLVTSLEVFRRSHGTRQKRHINRRVDKGKDKDAGQYGHAAFTTVHVHRMSLVTQIQDLFPDLGSAFIVKLLDEYENDVEQVTANLLEDSLPPHLSNADRFESLAIRQPQDNDLVPHLAPNPTPPASPLPERRNIFDNDEFDRLVVDSSRLHIGRKNATLTADKILSNRDPQSHSNHKAAILSALAAFDADDDERDDTYDLEDVGGTVDSARPGGADETDAQIDDMREKNEEALFSAFSMNPELFERDSTTRRGQPRQALKSETGLTDEAIEGWAIMIKRDPRRLRRLEAKYATFTGQQRALQGTAWRGSAGDSATEDSEASGAEGGRGGFRGRGRGRGGRGRGGRGGAGSGTGANVAGPADDKATQISRQRKETNKSSGANHNRRDQRAKKMARGGLPG